jgi:molecular chaperone HscB
MPSAPGQCWSCGEPRGAAEALCGKCGKPQAPPPAGTLVDNFAVLGVSQNYQLDPAQLEERFRALSRKLHPDKFARGGPLERRYSLEQTTLLNNAYRNLKDPLQRAQHLLALHGVDASGEPAPGKPREVVPMEFLEEAMADRERLLEAKLEGGPAEVEKLAQEVRGKRDEVIARLSAALRAEEWPKGAELVSRLRYYARFLDEVEGRERGLE